MDLLQNCSECYQATLSQFPDTITIVAALSPNTPYYIWVTDKFNNIYSTDRITTDSSGSIVLDAETIGLFPVGWFCKDAGAFMFEAKPIAPYYSETGSFTFGGLTYPCIWVTFEFNNAPKTAIV